LDAENARLAEEMNKAIEEELAETAMEKAADLSSPSPGQENPEYDQLIPPPIPSQEVESQTILIPTQEDLLETVGDATLFTAENLNDIPDEFSDD